MIYGGGGPVSRARKSVPRTGAKTKPFDAALRIRLEKRPADWLALAGLPAGPPVGAVSADLPAVAIEADRLLWMSTPPPSLAHIELKASHDGRLPERMRLYNVLPRRQHDLAADLSCALDSPDLLL
ncbi:MAG: hypothetical protein IT208_03100 [Chthonomonadales bacterium]|nr:hypothetical protein [Chthonomonadales bacterium]